jgi:hypothetical protein
VRGIACGGDLDDAPRAEVEKEEQEDGTEEKIVALDEIARPDDIAVILEEGRPRLARRPVLSYLPNVLLDRSLGQGNPELEQLATNALGPCCQSPLDGASRSVRHLSSCLSDSS